MGNFMGGSAPAMASQVVDGYYLLSANSLRKFLPGELAALKQELEQLQRQIRAETPAQDDAQANQLRNRKIARLSSALQIVGHQMTRRR
jgi:hypothetical protein